MSQPPNYATRCHDAQVWCVDKSWAGCTYFFSACESGTLQAGLRSGFKGWFFLFSCSAWLRGKAERMRTIATQLQEPAVSLLSSEKHQRSKSRKRNRGIESGTSKEKAKRMTAALSPPPDPSNEGDVSFRYTMRVGMGGLQHTAFLNSDATGNSPLWETVVHWEPHMHRPINTSVSNMWNLPHGPEILCVRNISIFFHNLISYLSDSTCTLLSKVNCFIYFPSEPDLKLYLNLIGLTKSAGKFFHSFFI